MNASLRHLGWSTLALFALAGCDTAPTPAPSQGPVPATAPPPESRAKEEVKALPVDKADAGKMEPTPAIGDSEKLTDKEMAKVKELPAADQPIALAQVVCPVSGGHLGGMGVPIKQEVDGKAFFLCCDGCVDKVKEDPKGVLAKLKK